MVRTPGVANFSGAGPVLVAGVGTNGPRLAAFSMLSSRAGDLRVFSRVSEGMTHANGVLTAEGKPLTQAEVDEVLAFIG